MCGEADKYIHSKKLQLQQKDNMNHPTCMTVRTANMQVSGLINML